MLLMCASCTGMGAAAECVKEAGATGWSCGMVGESDGGAGWGCGCGVDGDGRRRGWEVRVRNLDTDGPAARIGDAVAAAWVGMWVALGRKKRWGLDVGREKNRAAWHRAASSDFYRISLRGPASRALTQIFTFQGRWVDLKCAGRWTAFIAELLPADSMPYKKIPGS